MSIVRFYWTCSKIDGRYYFVYSGQGMHELCYAVSDKPDADYTYGGVIVSNCDLNIDTYKPAEKPIAFSANNHGGLVQIGEQWYIFYHRHTNGNWFCRQGCAEPVEILPDGSIPQVEITSCGLNGGPLLGKGEYPAYIACNLFGEDIVSRAEMFNFFPRSPRVMQDGRDGDEIPGHIDNIQDGSVIGFKYFDMQDVRKITLTTRAYTYGYFEVKTALDGEVLATIYPKNCSVWTDFSADIAMPNGKQALYLCYHGGGAPQLKSIRLE